MSVLDYLNWRAKMEKEYGQMFYGKTLLRFPAPKLYSKTQG